MTINKKTLKMHKKKSKKVIPFRKKKNYKPFIITTFSLIIILYIALFTPVFNVTNIEVLGNNKFDSNQIIDLSGLTIGENIFKVRYSEVKTNILKNQYLKSVKISRHYPGRISFKIEERIPVAYFEYMGSFLIIDKEGIVLDVMKSANDKSITKIEGIKFKDYSLGSKLIVNTDDNEKFDVALQCINSAIKYNIPNIIKRIDLKNIEYIVGYTDEEKYTINLIDSSEIDYKFKFLSEILKSEQDNKVNYIIDFTSSSRPVIKPNN